MLSTFLQSQKRGLKKVPRGILKFKKENVIHIPLIIKKETQKNPTVHVALFQC